MCVCFANFVLFCSFSSISLFEEFFEDEKSYVKCEASALRTLQRDNVKGMKSQCTVTTWWDRVGRGIVRGMKNYAAERKGKQTKEYFSVVCTVSGDSASSSDSCLVMPDSLQPHGI